MAAGQYIFNFIVGVIVVIAGTFGVKYNQKIVESFGQNNWFERKLGRGSTFTVYMILAFVTIFFGFFMMVGLHDEILRFVFAPVISIFQFD